MSRTTAQLALGVLLLSLAGPGCGEGRPQETATEKPAMPYPRVAAGDEDPGDNGPGDDLELDGVPGAMGAVKFSHFSHASNKEKGYGIPCRTCHHNVSDDGDSGACSECHKAPVDGADPAHSGPDDNMVLAAEGAAAAPVPFNHFTHASANGYKLPCATCHHKDDYLGPCSDCHGDAARMEAGKVVPRLKRAFHQQCKGCHEAIVRNKPSSPAPTGCERCHRGGTIPRVPGTLSLERAYHQSCVGCHQKVALADPEAKAPSAKCALCHRSGTAVIPGVKEAAGNETAPAEGPSVEDAGPSGDPGEIPAADAGVAIAQPAAGEASKGAAEIKLSGSDDGKKTRVFKHHEHQGYAESCKTCHHEGMEPPTCIGECHEAKDAKKIFHKQCRDCHKENGVEDKCSFCHE